MRGGKRSKNDIVKKQEGAFVLCRAISVQTFFFLLSVPESEGEVDSISSLCSQITNAFSIPSEDPFSSAPMTKPVTVVAPQSPAFQGVWPPNLDACDTFYMCKCCFPFVCWQCNVLNHLAAFLFASGIILF